MFKRFYPKECYKSTYEIDFQEFYNKGYRGIIFDIDNTLVPHNADADAQVMELFNQLRTMGFKVCLLSNNKESRVSRFNKDIGSDYICNAMKPSRKNYHKAMNIIGTDLEHTIFVGDQLFTDVWGANRTGIYSLLVGPLDSKEEIQIILKRIPEKIILKKYKGYQQIQDKNS